MLQLRKITAVCIAAYSLEFVVNCGNYRFRTNSTRGHDLAERIYERLSCQRKEASELVDLVIEMLKKAIVTEGQVKISGFGHFVIRQKADRNGRNPQTGESMTLSSRKVLMFKPSTILKTL